MGKFKLLIIILLFHSCKNENHCLHNYTNNPTRLGFTVDSIDNDTDECYYYSSFSICDLEDDTYPLNGKMFVRDSIFYYKIIEEQKSKYFPLFDLTKAEDYTVNIHFLDTNNIQIQNKLFVQKKQVLRTKNNKEVFVFSVSGAFCYIGGKYDGIFFINYEEGIIGKYLYFIGKNGKEYIAYPEGNIFRDQIDYSKHIGFQLK